jgi:hypothetical protein
MNVLPRAANRERGMASKNPGRAEYVVAPAEDGWVLRMKGDGVTEVFATKEDAVRRGRQLVERYATGNVTVLSRSGAVEREYVHDVRSET